MHTQGVLERFAEGSGQWLVRWECRGCGLRVGLNGPPAQLEALVDRLLWSDEARWRLSRLPPYVQALIRPAVEEFAGMQNHRVVSEEVLERARRGERSPVRWAPEAERRLANVPAAVRAMARLELERTAAELGQTEVTVALMEQVKARYFGMGTRG